MKKVILYQAPCGVRLRTIEELHQYLRVTGSPMSVDLFDFDYWVHCLAEFVLDKCFVNIKVNFFLENNRKIVLTTQNSISGSQLRRRKRAHTLRQRIGSCSARRYQIQYAKTAHRRCSFEFRSGISLRM